MLEISEIVQRICIILPTMFAAIVVHEYAHAWMASRYGDATAQWSGRLTLNPLAHIDPFGTVIFPIISVVLNAGIFFGWAKPVPIDPRRFTNYRKGLFWVALAGPAANIILGFLSAFFLMAYLHWVPREFSLFEAFLSMLQNFVAINFMLAVFNLLPIPPLDGAKMLESTLKDRALQKFQVLESYSFYILLALWISGALRLITYPILILSNIALNLAAAVFGMPGGIKIDG